MLSPTLHSVYQTAFHWTWLLQYPYRVKPSNIRQGKGVRKLDPPHPSEIYIKQYM
jgi:hypothetical protein